MFTFTENLGMNINENRDILSQWVISESKIILPRTNVSGQLWLKNEFSVLTNQFKQMGLSQSKIQIVEYSDTYQNEKCQNRLWFHHSKRRHNLLKITLDIFGCEKIISLKNRFKWPMVKFIQDSNFNSYHLTVHPF